MQEPKELIDQLLREKSVLKQDVFSATIDTFQDLKEVLKINELSLILSMLM